MPAVRRDRLRWLRQLAGLLAAAALSAAVAGCGGTHRHRTPPATAASAAGSSAAVSRLLVHILPATRLITTVDLDAARAELRLPRDQGPALAPGGGRERRGSGSSRQQRVRMLGELASLALPIVDDRPLLAALDLRDVHAAVQFGGVEHGGLLIATSQRPTAIATALKRLGWRASGEGFEYPSGGPAGLLEGSRVVLFAGGLVLAADAEDADAAAEQRAAPADDSQLLALLERSSAPARFAAVQPTCLRAILADERLAPDEGSVSIRTRGTPERSDVLLTPGDPLVEGLGLSVSRPLLRRNRVIV